MSKGLTFVKIDKKEGVAVTAGTYSCCQCHNKIRVESGTTSTLKACPECGYAKYEKK